MSYILDALKKSDEERGQHETADTSSAHSPFLLTEEKSSRKAQPVYWLLGLGLLLAAAWALYQLAQSVIYVGVTERGEASLASSPARESAMVIAESQHIGRSEDTPPIPRANAAQESAVVAAPSGVPMPSKLVQNSPTDSSLERMSEPEQLNLASVPSTQSIEQDSPEGRFTGEEMASTEELITPSTQQNNPASDSTEQEFADLPYLNELSTGDRRGIPEMEFSSHMFSSSPKFRSVVINGVQLKQGDAFAGDIDVIEITEEGVVLDKEGLAFRINVMQEWTFQ